MSATIWGDNLRVKSMQGYILAQELVQTNGTGIHKEMAPVCSTSCRVYNVRENLIRTIKYPCEN